MENITNIQSRPLLPGDSSYIKPFRFLYTQNGMPKSRDVLKLHDSISIILFNTSRNVLLFVKQFRPAVYHAQAFVGDINECDTVNYPSKLGVTIEICSRNVDQNVSLVDIAREEIQEKMGYTVSNERIQNVISFRTSDGRSGDKQTMFYCEVNDIDKSNHDIGVDDKLIEVVEYTIDDAKKLIQTKDYINAPATFLVGLLWFLGNQAEKFTK